MPRKYTPRVTLVCTHCGQTFAAESYRRNTAKYCSQACHYAHRVVAAPPAETRFWVRVDKSGPTPAHVPELGPCWIWTGAKNEHGYGTFAYDGRTRLAHVFVYTLTYGPPQPEKPEVTHLCDNGAIGCVRPAHLMADTHAGNMRQAAERARVLRGEQNRASKLTETAVRDIRLRYSRGGVTQLALAHEYSVSDSVISEIIARKAWKHA